ncbi:hypothetical protein FSC37_04370 [Piscinibacter aquaticus]|uniref:Tr-type G domain-containing protein n=1 Tax=Piscinibacter aquaticus TaxID=392597 RepID=A0A5C6U5N6_9BURK|nr:hypothetical protein FSC37_04370 [Piscinibacter aquaticus]
MRREPPPRRRPAPPRRRRRRRPCGGSEREWTVFSSGRPPCDLPCGSSAHPCTHLHILPLRFPLKREVASSGKPLAASRQSVARPSPACRPALPRREHGGYADNHGLPCSFALEPTVIIGTAGHIDHGKTSLVKALTGVDTDRLKEEKARGITIDLGFAYLPLPDGQVLGFVDVPGHEKLVRNMLAGATGIDHVLLVVAADDGPMPQTREHGHRRPARAAPWRGRLDQVRLVSPERLAAAEAEVHALLAGSGLAGAPVLPVSSTTGQGIAELRAHLTQAQAEPAADRSGGQFRLAIDRAFNHGRHRHGGHRHRGGRPRGGGRSAAAVAARPARSCTWDSCTEPPGQRGRGRAAAGAGAGRRRARRRAPRRLGAGRAAAYPDPAHRRAPAVVGQRGGRWRTGHRCTSPGRRRRRRARRDARGREHRAGPAGPCAVAARAADRRCAATASSCVINRRCARWAAAR